MTDEIDERISQRIEIIAKGRPGNRDDLHEHVLAAAEQAAGLGEITELHLDAAFAGLGTPNAIRDSFFPVAQTPVPRWAMMAFAGAAALASITSFFSNTATCTADVGLGNCTGASSGGELNLLVFGAPPLFVWTLHYLRPRWLPTLAGGAWALFLALPAAIGYNGGWGRIGVPLAGIVTLSTAIVLWHRRIE